MKTKQTNQIAWGPISLADIHKLTPDELAARSQRQRDVWEASGRCRHGNIRIEDDWILVEVVTEYHIKLDRVDQPWKLARWLKHLGKKPWMNEADLQKFQELVKGYFGSNFTDRTTPPHPNFMP